MAHPMTPEELEGFVRGLHYLASVDGMDAREEALIREFMKESGTELKFESLGEAPLNPTEAALLINTSYLRRVFLKIAVALVKADGVYSDEERKALGEFADAFGLSNAEFGQVEQDAANIQLESA